MLDGPCEGYDTTTVHGEYVTYGLSDEEIKERVKAFSPDVVGVTHPFSYLEKHIYGLCKLIKSIDKNIFTVAGGVHPSFSAEEMLRKCKELDCIVIGEGEERLLKLLDALKSDKSLGSLGGIAFRENKNIIVNSGATFIQDLDTVPFPARHLIDMEKYIKINKPANPFLKKERAERIFTSRGCPFRCCFCGGQRFWKNIRMRSADNVIGEMRLLKEKHNIQEIQFSDDNLTVDRKRALEIFAKMKEFEFVWCTPSGVMVNTLDEKMIKEMSASGCYQVTISPESGSQRVLRDIINKPLDLKSVKPMVDILHKYNINVHSNFILGLPGETLEELLQT